jgi:hypothetical protein
MLLEEIKVRRYHATIMEDLTLIHSPNDTGSVAPGSPLLE